MLFGLSARISARKRQKRNCDYSTVYNAAKSEGNLMGQSKNHALSLRVFALLTFKCLLQNVEMLVFLRELA